MTGARYVRTLGAGGAGYALFETRSLVLHIAQRHKGLLPDDADGRARAVTWMFAEIDTVEILIL